jgi:hypothetical protein
LKLTVRTCELNLHFQHQHELTNRRACRTFVEPQGALLLANDLSNDMPETEAVAKRYKRGKSHDRCRSTVIANRLQAEGLWTITIAISCHLSLRMHKIVDSENEQIATTRKEKKNSNRRLCAMLLN